LKNSNKNDIEWEVRAHTMAMTVNFPCPEGNVIGLLREDLL
jgi:hypothetical protein